MNGNGRARGTNLEANCLRGILSQNWLKNRCSLGENWTKENLDDRVTQNVQFNSNECLDQTICMRTYLLSNNTLLVGLGYRRAKA